MVTRPPAFGLRAPLIQRPLPFGFTHSTLSGPGAARGKGLLQLHTYPWSLTSAWPVSTEGLNRLDI